MNFDLNRKKRKENNILKMTNNELHCILMILFTASFSILFRNFQYSTSYYFLRAILKIHISNNVL